MSFVLNFPAVSIVLSLAASVASVAARRWAKQISCLVVVLGMAMSAAVLAYTASAGAAFTYVMGQAPAPWGNELRIGILEPLFALLFGLVLLLCILSGETTLSEKADPKKRYLFFVLCDLIQASLFALCYTNDLFTSYVFIEICTIASSGILMIRDNGPTATAATRYMIFSLVGSSLFLLGVIMLYGVTGHLLMEPLRKAVASVWAAGTYRLPLRVIIVLLVVGLGIKSGLFPFHFWMADTYGTSLPGAAGILSGIVSKGYIFLLLKLVHRVIGPDVFYASGAQNVLFLFGVLGMIVGSISAIHTSDVRHMIAYSSAAQIGYIYMGVGISPALGTVAALFHVLTHALTKPALFLSASRLADVSGGSNDFHALQGSAHRNRVAGIVFSVGSMSMVGIPAFMGFISKIQFALAGAQAGAKMLPTFIALAVSTVLNVLYFMRTVIRIYTPAPEQGEHVVRARQQLVFDGTALCFIGLNVAIGLFSQPVIELLGRGLALLG